MSKFLVIPDGEEENGFDSFEQAKDDAEEISVELASDYGEDRGSVHIYKLYAVVTTKVTPVTKLVLE